MDDDLDLSKVLLDVKEQEIPDEEKLSRLSKLVREQITIQSDIAKAEEYLDNRKKDLKKVSEGDIPSLFDELGIDEFRLKTGVGVTIVPYYSGKITTPEAYEWLEENDHGDIIKGLLAITYPKGFDQSKLRQIVKLAEELGLTVENQESVHSSTLKAWIKEMVSTGQEFPRELFNVYVGRKTKLSLK